MAYTSAVFLLAAAQCVAGFVPEFGPGPVIINKPTPSPPRCQSSRVCPLVYEPVCGENCDGKKTFGNTCELEAANDCQPKEKQYTEISKGECSQTPPNRAFCKIECPPISQFNCIELRNGTRREIKINQCGLNQQSNNCFGDNNYLVGAKFIGEGPCPAPPTQPPTSNQCGTTFCQALYDPVCGQNADGIKTFSNACQIIAQNECLPENLQYTEIYKGKCQKAPPPTQGPCPRFCQQSVTLTCVKLANGTNREIYTNPCFFQIQANNCNGNRGYLSGATYVGVGPCPKSPPKSTCNISCPLMTTTAPQVCGSYRCQQQTFNNMCGYANAKACQGYQGKIIHEGPCVPTCPSNLDRVCAISSGNIYKTFYNQCILDNTPGWTKVCNGGCDQYVLTLQNNPADFLVL